MLVADQLYSPSALPGWLDDLLLSPEVQRLRQIRLINTASPTVASLSDVRRFSHILGVVRLAADLEQDITAIFGDTSYRLFLAAAALHDIGTPPFGHLFEYLLNAQHGWHHEAVLPAIFDGSYRPEGMYHQVFFGHRLQVAETLRNLNIDPHGVADVVRGVGQAGELLAGTIDIDNIDNVYRMASHLGVLPVGSRPQRAANAISIDENGVFFHKDGLGGIAEWRDLRRACYERLLFDTSCLSGQAMLTDAISQALLQGRLGPQHWDLTDEQLIEKLYSAQELEPASREAVRRFVVGDFYRTLLVGWYDGRTEVDLRRPDKRAELNAALSESMGMPCSTYVYYDRGTFEKRLALRVRDQSGAFRITTMGHTSSTTIVAVVTRRRDVPARGHHRAIEDVLKHFGLDPARLRSSASTDHHKRDSAQISLPV